MSDDEGGQMENGWDRDPDVKRWVDHVLGDMFPKLRSSAVAVSIAPLDSSEGDVKYWVELGASIMLDKPIIVVAKSGQELPSKLVAVADQVVRADDISSSTFAADLADAIKRIIGD